MTEYVKVSELLPILESELRLQDRLVSNMGVNFSRRMWDYRNGVCNYAKFVTAEKMLAQLDAEYRTSELTTYDKGEPHKKYRKLTAKDRREIIKKYRSPWVTQKMLGDEYGVVQTTIGYVVRTDPNRTKIRSSHIRPKGRKPRKPVSDH